MIEVTTTQVGYHITVTKQLTVEINGGMHKGYSCCNEIQNGTGSPSGPFTAPWSGSANHYCAGDMACCAGHSVFPGGGGVGDGNAAGTACVGGFGAGGLVKVTYQ